MLAIQDEACDLRLLGTSPALSKDYFNNPVVDFCPPYYEEDIAAEVNVQCVNDFDERSVLYSESTYTTTSCGTSVTSDFSEDSYFDNDDEFDPFHENEEASLDFKSNGMTNSNDSINENSNTTTQKVKDSYQEHYSDLDDSEMLAFNECGQYDLPRKNSKSRKSECTCCELRKRMAGLSWSKMSSDDQMKSIEYLTRVVSTTLGLREQLDIIRIISPDATISSTDTEFFIDLDAFTDDKFHRLKQYFNEHVLNSNCRKCSESRQKRSQIKSSPTSHPKYSKRKTPKPLSTKPVSKKSRKSKGLLSRIHRQMEKEKRSGLFSKEEVLSLSRKPTLSECDEDIEVDILC